MELGKSQIQIELAEISQLQLPASTVTPNVAAKPSIDGNKINIIIFLLWIVLSYIISSILPVLDLYCYFKELDVSLCNAPPWTVKFLFTLLLLAGTGSYCFLLAVGICLYLSIICQWYKAKGLIYAFFAIFSPIYFVLYMSYAIPCLFVFIFRLLWMKTFTLN
jgi:hypothetical protein